MDYLESNPEVLEQLKNNQKPFGFCNHFLFQRAEREGYAFERFSHLGIFREPEWIKETRPVEKWQFTETFRVAGKKQESDEKPKPVTYNYLPLMGEVVILQKEDGAKEFVLIENHEVMSSISYTAVGGNWEIAKKYLEVPYGEYFIKKYNFNVKQRDTENIKRIKEIGNRLSRARDILGDRNFYETIESEDIKRKLLFYSQTLSVLKDENYKVLEYYEYEELGKRPSFYADKKDE